MSIHISSTEFKLDNQKYNLVQLKLMRISNTWFLVNPLRIARTCFSASFGYLKNKYVKCKEKIRKLLEIKELCDLQYLNMQNLDFT